MAHRILGTGDYLLCVGTGMKRAIHRCSAIVDEALADPDNPPQVFRDRMALSFELRCAAQFGDTPWHIIGRPSFTFDSYELTDTTEERPKP